jgi:hypothetical protein
MSVCRYGIVDHGKEPCTCRQAFAAAGVAAPPTMAQAFAQTRALRKEALARQRAREAFEAAGRPVPEWCR